MHYMKAMVLQIGAYGLMEHADVDAVFKTIVDHTCTMLRRALHGAKTGNSKDSVQIEEQWLKVEKSTKEREIPPKDKMMKVAGPMEEKSEEEKVHVWDLIKRFWAHTAHAHEEAGAATSILQLLADEVNEQTYTALMKVGTRPLIMMQVPQMATQVVQMDYEQERQEKTKEMKGQPIEEIIEQYNVLRQIERWVNLSILLPTWYLAAMVYYSIYGEVDAKK